MGALQELPRDVLLIILFKLARQDAVALVHASSACRALRAAAENDPHLWQTTFLFPAVSSDFCKNELEGFKAEVESLGGYKRLLAARAATSMYREKREQTALEGEQSEQAKPKQKERTQRFNTSGFAKRLDLESESEPCNTQGSALVLLRLKGMPVAYRAFSLSETVPGQGMDWCCFILKSLVPWNKTSAEMARHFPMAGSNLAGFKRRSNLDTDFVVLEVFACKGELKADSGVGAREKGEDAMYEAFTLKKGSGWILQTSSNKQFPWFKFLLSGCIQRPDLLDFGRVRTTNCTPLLNNMCFGELGARWIIDWKPRNSDFNAVVK